MKGLDNIIGNKEIINHFYEGIKKGRISHAYIIQGDKGMGKRQLVDGLAKILQCEGKDIEKPCGICHSCRLFETSNHPDIIYITSSKLKHIGVEDIRKQLNHDIYIKPYKFPYKIYIIDEAEKLTEEAQNAMLKTIEEPPSYGIVFLLTTNKYTFLPTVLSRCIHFDLKPLKDEEMAKYLMNEYDVTAEEVQLYVAFAGGNIGRAKMLMTSESFNDIRQRCIRLLSHLDRISVVELLEEIKAFDNYKDQIEDVLDFMLTWYRDLLVVKSTREKKGLIHKDAYNSLLKLSHLITYNKLGQNIKYIESTKQKLRYNVNFQLSLETLFLKIKES